MYIYIHIVSVSVAPAMGKVVLLRNLKLKLVLLFFSSIRVQLLFYYFYLISLPYLNFFILYTSILFFFISIFTAVHTRYPLSVLLISSIATFIYLYLNSNLHLLSPYLHSYLFIHFPLIYHPLFRLCDSRQLFFISSSVRRKILIFYQSSYLSLSLSPISLPLLLSPSFYHLSILS